MKNVIQRVSHASVTVEGKIVGKIGRGLLLLSGFSCDDTEEVIQPAIRKILNMRIFPDQDGRFHYSVLDEKAEILIVPQFTLFADTSKGRRPEFFAAMRPEKAEPLFHTFAEQMAKSSGLRVERGLFGADMKVELLNDGPVTIIL